jgi:hypothetical protein
MEALQAIATDQLLKLDLGCGKTKKAGFLGVDRRPYEGVDVVADLLEPWPWGDGTVGEIHASHVIEHFTGLQRVHIMNEMYRVLAKGGTAFIATPYWCSNRAYGDFTHQWPPVSEMWFYYLRREWRLANAPDTDISINPEGFSCDFECPTYSYGVHPQILSRHGEAQQWALTFYKEAAQDLMATVTKL